MKVIVRLREKRHQLLERPAWFLVEAAAWATGLAALSIWAVATLTGTVGARQDLQRFASARDAHVRQAGVLPPAAPPDMRGWAFERQVSFAESAVPPLAILRIPKIQLEVAVLPGTSAAMLNRGVGHIAETALPGADSNSGIAGHRDGFFRGLKDVAPGDAIEVETLTGRQIYVVEHTWIVDPDDLSVLAPTPDRALTLVTCYPFHFLGSAPKRFIVRALSADEPGSP